MGAARRNSRRRSRRPLQVGASPSVAQASHEPSAGGPTPASAYSAAGPAVSLGSAIQRADVGSGDRMIRVPPDGVVHPIAAQLNRPGTHFRVPNFADLQAAYTDKKLAIPESVFQARVGQLLGRMRRDKIGIVDLKGNPITRLKTLDDVPTILAKIFPAPGVIDQVEFENAVDVTNRRRIYATVLDAQTTVKPADQPKLKTTMKDAADLITTVQGDAAGLTAVFGTRAADAKKNYGAARTALLDIAKDLDKHVTTDYNLDDPEVNLGGWANFAGKHMHLLAEIVLVTDPNESKTTLIHEAAHLSDPSVDDHGYYGTPNFEALPESIKVSNAGHYEELPKRVLKTSSYVGETFTPGKLKGGGAVTWEDTIKRSASEYLRQAWDAAVDTHTFIRGVRKSALGGSKSPFTSNVALIKEISKLMDLTIHEQDPANAQVTTLDVTLTESIAHGVGIIGGLADGETVTKPAGPFKTQADEDAAARNAVIDAATARYGRLLGAPARDRKLLDWLVAHYRNLP